MRLFRKPAFSSEPPDSPAELGVWGEAVATAFLKKNHFRILYRNYRPPHGGEVDVVARHIPTATLCFTEVKTRTTEIYGRPADAVDWKKQRLIVRGAMAWMRLLQNPDIPFRFDIVEVHVDSPPRCNLIENAFQLPEKYFY